MFKKFTLKNYKTHKLTTIELSDVTLLIGNNSSGKTNLLSGIQHFANLVRRGNPLRESNPTVQSGDYFPHKHRLANKTEIMSIEVVWSKIQSEVIYKLKLYTSNNLDGNVGCREQISINISGNEQELKNGFEEETQFLGLQKKLNQTNLADRFKIVHKYFFRDFSNVFSYHFQPSFLNDNLTLKDLEYHQNFISVLNIPDA
ncbi:MAG: AAA family ATPase [Cyanobacteria bacterium P01_E01_bin.42]